MSEAATPRLLQVEEALQVSLAEAVVALHAAASHAVPVGPGPGLLNEG